MEWCHRKQDTSPSHHHVIGKWLEADLVSPPARMLQRRADVSALAANGSLPNQIA